MRARANRHTRTHAHAGLLLLESRALLVCSSVEFRSWSDAAGPKRYRFWQGAVSAESVKFEYVEVAPRESWCAFHLATACHSKKFARWICPSGN